MPCHHAAVELSLDLGLHACRYYGVGQGKRSAHGGRVAAKNSRILSQGGDGVGAQIGGMMASGSIAQLGGAVHLYLVHLVIGQQVGLAGRVKQLAGHVGLHLLGGAGTLPYTYIVYPAVDIGIVGAEDKVAYGGQAGYGVYVHRALPHSVHIEIDAASCQGDGHVAPLVLEYGVGS